MADHVLASGSAHLAGDLLEYLDEDDELRLDAVQRLRLYASSLLDGSLTPSDVHEDWPDWFDLAPAFVVAYGTKELSDAENATDFLGAVEEHEQVRLTDADRSYLRELDAWLDMYPEMRTTEE
jgi:hypothetical protein